MIAKVTRKFSNSAVSEQIKLHLEEHGYPKPHPCKRAIMRMLENMKASTTKSLAGICSSQFSLVSGCRFEESGMNVDSSEENSMEVDGSGNGSGDGEEDATSHDGDGCVYCEAIPMMFKVMTGIVRSMNEHLSQVQMNQMIYNLQRSEFHIHVFKGFITFVLKLGHVFATSTSGIWLKIVSLVWYQGF